MRHGLKTRDMATASIRDIVKDKAKEKGLSLNRLALVLGIARQTLSDVLKGRKTSRPTIQRISKLLDIPELPHLYEEMLQQMRAEKNKKNSTGGRSG